MRDIRDDLRARRAAVIGRYSDAMHRFEVENERLLRERREAVDIFEREKATLDAMIAMEDRRQVAAGSTASAPTGVTLGDFLIAQIRSAGPINKDELALAAEAAGYAERGRAFNMTLQNVAKGSQVEKLEDGRYVGATSASNLFGMARTAQETPMTAQ